MAGEIITEVEQEEEEREEFTVNSDSAAEWCLTKIKELTAEKDRMITCIDDMLNMYHEKREKTIEDFDRKKSYFVGKLFEYSNKVEMAETKTQYSYRLPSGSLVVKKPKMVFNHDDEALTNWLKANAENELIEVKEKPRWAEVKKKLSVIGGAVIFSETGEVVEGVSATEEPESFEVKI